MRLFRPMTATLAAVLTLTGAVGAVAASDNRNFTVQLSGGEEVPARATKAHGVAKFQLSQDGSSLGYKLQVANIENVVAAHIHVGEEGVNGPVVAFLYGPATAGGGDEQGRLSEGTITAANLVGPLAGGSVARLEAELRSGNAYVNVHTNDGVGAPNSGPGDFPGGEIRGQFGKHGSH